MAKASTVPEPTMDEILASIRRMISDGEQPVLPGPRSVSQTRPAKVTKLFADDAEPEGTDPVQVGDDNVIELAIARAMEDARIEVAAEAAIEAAVAEVPEFFPAVAEAQPEAPAAVAVVSAPAEPPADAPEPPAPAGATAETPASAATVAAESARIAEESPQPLMSPQADVAVAGAFNRLAVSMLSRSARTIDELVEDLLRPLLRGWLDNNLPPLVERLVREEIERVSRGRR